MSDYKHIWHGKPKPDSLMTYLGISEREYMELVSGRPMSEDDYKQTLTVGELKDFEARRRRDSIEHRGDL